MDLFHGISGYGNHTQRIAKVFTEHTPRFLSIDFVRIAALQLFPQGSSPDNMADISVSMTDSAC